MVIVTHTHIFSISNHFLLYYFCLWFTNGSRRLYLNVLPYNIIIYRQYKYSDTMPLIKKYSFIQCLKTSSMFSNPTTRQPFRFWTDTSISVHSAESNPTKAIRKFRPSDNTILCPHFN